MLQTRVIVIDVTLLLRVKKYNFSFVKYLKNTVFKVCWFRKSFLYVNLVFSISSHYEHGISIFMVCIVLLRLTEITILHTDVSHIVLILLWHELNDLIRFDVTELYFLAIDL